MEEIWKDVLGYEGLYQVSNYGNVRKIDTEIVVYSDNQHGKYKTNRKYKQRNRKLQSLVSGYKFVVLFKNGTRKMHLVHRLVWEAFNGPIPEGLQVNHINENKADNRLINLNLMTPKENMNWGTGIKRRVEKQINKQNSKIVLQYTLDGKFVKEWPSTKEIERTLGYDNSHVGRCCLHKYKTAYGYIWRYKKSEE